MHGIDYSWIECYQPDINRMFQIDDKRIRSGMGWHKVILISEHRALFTDKLCRISMRVEDLFPVREKKVKKIYRKSNGW